MGTALVMITVRALPAQTGDVPRIRPGMPEDNRTNSVPYRQDTAN